MNIHAKSNPPVSLFWSSLSVIALLAPLLSMLWVSSPAQAGDKGLHLAIGGMGFFNTSQQGGTGPSGSTILTQADLVYHGKWWGLGAYAQYDMQGSNQIDFAVGPKAELHASVFYLEGGYSVLMQRAFTDRSIQRQSGDGWIFGIGARFKLGGKPGAGKDPGKSKGGFFLQFSYKYRIQNIRTQDSVALGDAIVQTDGYPLFGVGYVF